MIELKYINSKYRTPVQALCLFVNLYAVQQINDVNNSNWWWNSSTTFMIMDTQRRHTGLWNTCITDGSGFSCEGVDTFWIALPTLILSARYLLYVSLISCLVSSVCYYLGSNLTNLFTNRVISYEEVNFMLDKIENSKYRVVTRFLIQ